MTLKNPSDFFEEGKKESIVEKLVERPELKSFSDAFNVYKENISKFDNLSETLKNIENIQSDIKDFIKKEDLDNATISYAFLLEETVSKLKDDVKGINEKHLIKIRSNVSSLAEKINNFVEVEAPKYKKSILESEIKSSDRYEKFKNDTDIVLEDIAKYITNNEEKTEENITSLNETLDKVVEDLEKKINLISDNKDTIFQNLSKKITEVKNLKKSINKDLKVYEDHKNNVEDKISDLEVEIVRSKSNLKENLKKQNEEFVKVQKNVKTNFNSIRKEFKTVVDKLNLDNLEEKNNELSKKVRYLEEVFAKFNEKEFLSEGLLNIPPETKNSDPLTPLNKDFVTLDQLQNHYRLFLNRIQQQLATFGGGGETQLKYLDDVVGIATNPAAYDGGYLRYVHSLKKFAFSSPSDGDTWIQGVDGPYTMGRVGIGTSLIQSGDYPGNALVVDGNARFTGIVSIGTSSITLDASTGSIAAGDVEVVSAGGGAKFVGVITAGGANFTGDVSIGGTLTYEDVKNVDSIGIITANKDVRVGRNFNVTGLSTFTGITTFSDDVYVGGNINVVGDIVYDEVSGRNLNVSGVSTVNNLIVSGIASFTSSSHTKLPSGTTAQRPASAVVGDFRYNTTTNQFEGYKGSSPAWGGIGGGSPGGANTQIQFNDSGSFEGDANLTFDGSKLAVGVDLDVDGHTELDDVNVSGVATIGNVTVGGATTDLIVEGNARVTGILSVGTGTVIIDETTVKTGTSNLHSVGIEIAGINVLGADTPIGTGATIYNSGAAIFTGIVTATTFSGSGTSLTSIPNSALDNSTVSFGGIELALGAADANPAFNLTDATNYPYTSLTGIVTHIVGDTTPQLGGNLDGNSKDIYGVGVLTATSVYGTLQTAAQPNITSVGTLTGLDVNGHSELDNINVSGVSTFSNEIDIASNRAINFGSGTEGRIKHYYGGDFAIEATSENIQITNYANDKDVVIGTDDGSGGTANYFVADGSTGETILYNYGNEKIKTTGSGVNVTGILTTTQIADSNGSVGSASSVLSSTGSGLSWVAQSTGGSGIGSVGIQSGGVLVGSATTINFTAGNITVANDIANVSVGSSFAYAGARVYFSTGTPDGTGAYYYVVASEITAVNLDTHSFYNASNGRFEIPAGVTKVRLRANVWADGGSGSVANAWQAYKNGSAITLASGGFFFEVESGSGYTNVGASGVSGAISVSEGDYIQVAYNVNSTNRNWAGTWQLEVLEGSLLGHYFASTNVTNSDNITVQANNTADETVYPIFVDGATGIQGPESDTGFTYNPSSGNLTATQLTGTLQTAAQTNITSVGTIGGGTWQGTAIADAYIASAVTWNAKQAALTFGIADTNALKIDDSGAANGEYAQLTTSGIAGVTTATLKSNLSLNNVENTALSTWAGTSNITTVGTLGSLNVTGDVSIGGTLTYEDVTNIDSVGLITARSGIKVTSGGINVASGVVTATTFDAPSYHMDNTPTKDKYRFWTNSQWAMGMDDGMSFGGLNSYAITLQAAGTSDDRGWVFLDSSHSDAQGAMSLNTIGELVVAKSIRAGGGESDTSAPRKPLDITGDGIIIGDVGIGTINPTGTAALTNNEKVLAVGVVTATNFYGTLKGTADSATNASGLTGTPDITVGTIVGTALSVSGISTFSDGDVLIGGHTQGGNDSSKLSVYDSGSNIGIIQVHCGTEAAGDLAGITFGQGGSNSTARPKTAIAAVGTLGYGRGDLCFYVDGTADNNPVSTADEKLRIKSTGYVGIGLTNPSAKLDVYVNNTDISGIIQVTQDGTGDAAIDFQLVGTREYSLGIDNSDSDKFKLSSTAGLGSNDLITVTTDGDVGIGSEIPASKLDVNGTITATTFDGNATTATTATLSLYSYMTNNNTTNETVYPVFVDGTTTSEALETDSGFMYNPSTGILTATGFSGSGASLDTLNASELDSGTIPDARFPATLPAASGANLTSLPGGELTGIVTAARLASNGTANSSTFLRGDGSWASAGGGFSADSEENLYAGTGAGNASDADTCFNVAIGYSAGYSNASGDGNVFIGKCAGYCYNDTGLIAIGDQVGASQRSGNYNIYFGKCVASTVACNNTSAFNFGAGFGVLKGVTTGSCNVAIGYEALGGAVTGGSNIAFGRNAGGSGMSGNDNTSIGRCASNSGGSGSDNIVLGCKAALYMSSGSNNIVMGECSMGGDSITGSDNISFGNLAGKVISSGNRNIILGQYAGCSLTSNNDNIVIGKSAASSMSGDGAQNVFLGMEAGCTQTTTCWSVAIGQGARLPITNGCKQLSIGCYSKSWIIGDCCFNIGIGTTVPTAAVGVGNTAKLSVGIVSAYMLYGCGANLTALNASNLASGTVATARLGTGSADSTVFLRGDGTWAAAGFTQDSQANLVAGTGAGAAKDADTCFNILLGCTSGAALNEGDHNTFIGGYTGESTTSGGCNIALGMRTLATNTSGDYNVAIGAEAGRKYAGANGCNIYIGNRAGCGGTGTVDGVNNIMMGLSAGRQIDGGDNNIFIGCYAGKIVSSGYNNILLGDQVGVAVTSGNHNFMVGCHAGKDMTTSSCNIAIGLCAMSAHTVGHSGNGNNVAIGQETLQKSNCFNNIGIGKAAGKGGDGTVSYKKSIFIGTGAGQEINSGNCNIFIGESAGKGDTTDGITGSDNIVIGQDAGCLLSSGDTNIFIGKYAGKDTTTGSRNIAIGKWSMRDGTTTGLYNNMFGDQSGYKITSGGRNNGMGNGALYDLTEGLCNVAIGAQAGYKVSTGDNNILLGHTAGCLIAGGDENVIIGKDSGKNTADANKNVFLGSQAGETNTSGCCNVAIGYDVDLPSATGNTQFAIGVGNTNWISGDCSYNIQPGAGILDKNGNVGTAASVLTSTGSAIEWKASSGGSSGPDPVIMGMIF